MLHRVVIAVVGLLLTPSISHAQSDYSIALDKFDPAPAGDVFFGVSSSQTSGHLVVRGRLLLTQTQRTLVVDHEHDGPAPAARAIVSSQALMHVGASIALWDRLLFHTSAPVVLTQRGDEPSTGAAVFRSPSGTQAGDLRIGSRISLHGHSDDVFQVATGVSIHVPTGRASSFTSDGGMRLASELVLSGKTKVARWSAVVRPTFHRSGNPSTVSFGAAVAFSLLNDTFRIGPEIFASTPESVGAIDLRDDIAGPESKLEMKTNVELWLGAQIKLYRSLSFGAAGGPGLDTAAGTPAYRVVGMLHWSPEPKRTKPAHPPPLDTDADGLIDQKDACPYAFADRMELIAHAGCPTIDTDDDGVADKEDICPDTPRTTYEDPIRRGCPIDMDRDQVPDSVDLCPQEEGDRHHHGCRNAPAAN